MNWPFDVHRFAYDVCMAITCSSLNWKSPLNLKLIIQSIQYFSSGFGYFGGKVVKSWSGGRVFVDNVEVFHKKGV